MPILGKYPKVSLFHLPILLPRTSSCSQIGCYLEFPDVDLDVSDAGGRCYSLQPLQLWQHPAKPGSDIRQVRVKLLPLFQVLLDVRCVFMCL